MSIHWKYVLKASLIDSRARGVQHKVLVMAYKQKQISAFSVSNLDWSSFSSLYLSPWDRPLSLSSTALPSDWHVACPSSTQEVARCYPWSCIGSRRGGGPWPWTSTVWVRTAKGKGVLSICWRVGAERWKHVVNLSSETRASDCWMRVLSAFIHLPSAPFSGNLSVQGRRCPVKLILVREEACPLVVSPSVLRTVGCYEWLNGKKGKGEVAAVIFTSAAV